MPGKFDHELSMVRGWIPWLRSNEDLAEEDVDLSLEKLESDLKGLSPAQLRLIKKLINQMKIINEEGNKSFNRSGK